MIEPPLKYPLAALKSTSDYGPPVKGERRKNGELTAIGGESYPKVAGQAL
jgi:hypothetical protein